MYNKIKELIKKTSTFKCLIFKLIIFFILQNIYSNKPISEEKKTFYPPDIQRIKDKGELVIAQYKGSRDGFFMYDNSNNTKDSVYYEINGKKLIGYDIQIASNLAKRLGVKLTIDKSAPGFTDACEMVASGKADLAVSKITVKSARGQFVRFSDPYITLRLGVLINRLQEVAKKRGKDTVSICNNADVTMAVQKGSVFEFIIPDIFPKAKIKYYKNLKASVDAVKNGEVMATVNDEWNIGTILRKNPEISLRVRLAFLEGRNSHMAVVVNPKDTLLHSFVNLVLEEDGLKTTPQKLMEKYFPKGAAMLSSAIDKAGSQTKETSNEYGPVIFIGIILLTLLTCWIFLSIKKINNQ